MPVSVRAAGPESIDRIARIPIAFTVAARLEASPRDGGLGGLELREVAVAAPYAKDLDAGTDAVGTWPLRFDLTRWGFLLAGDDPDPDGAATVAGDGPGAPPDAAVLWDLRVHPRSRRRGIGSALLAAAAAWASERGRRRLLIETQDTNVAACRFYAARGCCLVSIDRLAYAGTPAVAHETRLTWCLDLPRSDAPAATPPAVAAGRSLETLDLGPAVQIEVLTVRWPGDRESSGPTAGVCEIREVRAVATEVPLTILVDESEIATIQCTPQHLTELVHGFLFSAGVIQGPADIRSVTLDATRWIARVEPRRQLDLDRLGRRIYTPGCGKGIVFSEAIEAAARLPMLASLTIAAQQVKTLAGWLQHASSLWRDTRGVHTAGLSLSGELPLEAIDDIGRHNAADKVIGRGLLQGIDFGRAVLVSSGRISSEILHKAKRCGIPILVARGGPTHQTVLRARSMGITVVGFARGASFTIYSHPQRIDLGARD